MALATRNRKLVDSGTVYVLRRHDNRVDHGRLASAFLSERAERQADSQYQSEYDA